MTVIAQDDHLTVGAWALINYVNIALQYLQAP